ncbi:MAG: hypothetical protein KGL46_09995 [Hyphomicrobiales bacterium]|nr:hypothetical protein [Hyphomicrobiales bacterium]
MIVYCFRSGEIGFAEKCSQGAIALAKHEDGGRLHEIVGGIARSEAPDAQAALSCADHFADRIAERL